MDMDRLREWLISKGITEEELDGFVETPVIEDLGEGLTLSLMNDEMLGMDMFMLMMRLDEMEGKFLELEERVKEMEENK